jgi:hypothetical protein
LDYYSKTRPDHVLARGAESNTAAWNVELSLALRKITWRTPGEVASNFHAVGLGEE